MSEAPATNRAWIFSRTVDLWVFGGSAALALLWLWFAQMNGEAGGGQAPAPISEATWIATVLLVDVAHVWSTGLLVYVDGSEFRRRRALYLGVPIACFAVGVALYALAGPLWFWRILAYLAVIHFVRQQFGWVMMYRARAGETSRSGRFVDGAAIYAATVVPLIWWHANLPRQFAWFVDGDFTTGLAAANANNVIGSAALFVGAAIGIVYLVRLATNAASLANSGKHLIVGTTAACWFGGIVLTNGDIAFTVTNVLIHGIPYVTLVYFYARSVGAVHSSRVASFVRVGPWMLLVTLWAIAFAEELLWDRSVWHERSYLFGSVAIPGSAALWVALLATPQATHYVLDAFFWRRAANPRLAEFAKHR